MEVSETLSLALMAAGGLTFACLDENSHQGGLLDSIGITGALTNWSVAPVIQTGGAYNINVGELIEFAVGAILIILFLASRHVLTGIGALVGAFLIADGAVRYTTGSDI